MYFSSCQTEKKKKNGGENKRKEEGEKMSLMLSNKNKTLKSKVEF